MVYTYKTSTREVEAGGSVIQDQHTLYRSLRLTSGYMRLSLKKNNQKYRETEE